MQESNPQTRQFPQLVTGAVGYRTRSDPTATPSAYLVAGSQNVLINEATDTDGDKVESRAGYEVLGQESEDLNGIRSEHVFRTKVGEDRMLRFLKDGTLEFFDADTSLWEVLMDGLLGDYPCRFTTWWDAEQLLRRLLFVNHSSLVYSWSGATATLASMTATTVTINESIGTRGFLQASSYGTLRIKDSTGVWRETAYTSLGGSEFTTETDLTGYTFDANAPVVQAVSVPEEPFNSFDEIDVIKTLENHVYYGSHASSVVEMSHSDDYTDLSFSSPRVATEGWQFVLDDFVVGFETNISGEGRESLVMFAHRDWIYRVEFIDLSDSSTIAQIASVKPIIVSSGQGAVAQELITKVKNSIIFLNAYNELLELGSVENISTVQQTPLSDPIKPDFIAADFTGGALRFWRNNLYATAPLSVRTFILAFREDERGTRRFWQPPQTLGLSALSDFGGDLIGHSSSVEESYTLFTGTNDAGQPISFKAFFAYRNYGAREKLKNFLKYFTELYVSANAIVNVYLIFEYLGAKSIQVYEIDGSDERFLFTPNPSASLGVNSLGTAPLGVAPGAVDDLVKYRRFKQLKSKDFFEMQTRFECDEIDSRFQILCHGPDAVVSKNAPQRITG